jgi:hypothetical protein
LVSYFGDEREKERKRSEKIERNRKKEEMKADELRPLEPVDYPLVV